MPHGDTGAVIENILVNTSIATLLHSFFSEREHAGRFVQIAHIKIKGSPIGESRRRTYGRPFTFTVITFAFCGIEAGIFKAALIAGYGRKTTIGLGRIAVCVRQSVGKTDKL